MNAGDAMTELNFKGKEFVYNHHLAVPFRPLEIHSDKGIGKPRLDGNLIIQGDNLHALKSLLPIYGGKVDCIFIDPPYNTGNEGWAYNDNVNSPMIKEWLAANPIGVEDGLRHDKWCAMMWPRLSLLKELLAEDGVIFVCIDDNELYNLRLMLDQIFDRADNWIGTIIWKNVTDNNPTRIAIEHEYIVCFSKNKEQVERVWKTSLSDVKDLLVQTGDKLIQKFPNEIELEHEYKKWFRANKHELWPLDRYKYIDRGGIFTGSQSVHNPGKEGYRYDVLHPVTKKPCKQPLMGYRFPEETMKQLIDANKILFGEDHNKIIELKLYAREYQEKLPSVIELDGRTSAYELRSLFPDEPKNFDHAKPTALVERILSFVTKKDALILDSFAGSGTTGHAVAALNASDNGNRKFILIECMDYAETLTRERVRRAMMGIAGVAEKIEGLGGEFTYCTLGTPVELDRVLTGETLPEFEALGSVLFHMATNQAFEPARADIEKGYLGESGGQHVWLIYKPDIEWLKSPEAALTLNKAREYAEAFPKAKHLVMAPARYVSQKLLAEENLPVEFVPLPFALYRIERN